MRKKHTEKGLWYTLLLAAMVLTALFVTMTMAGCKGHEPFGRSGRSDHNHSYEKTSFDDSHHWLECTSCADTLTKYKHYYDDENDVSCNACGYIRKLPDDPNHPTSGQKNGPGMVESTGMCVPSLAVPLKAAIARITTEAGRSLTRMRTGMPA